MLPTRGAWRKRCAYQKKNSQRLFAVALPSFGSALFRKGAYWRSMKPSRGTAAIRGLKSSVTRSWSLISGLTSASEKPSSTSSEDRDTPETRKSIFERSPGKWWLFCSLSSWWSFMVSNVCLPSARTSPHANEQKRNSGTLSGQLLRLQDEERRRIARDLHDST